VLRRGLPAALGKELGAGAGLAAGAVEDGERGDEPAVVDSELQVRIARPPTWRNWTPRVGRPLIPTMFVVCCSRRDIARWVSRRPSSIASPRGPADRLSDADGLRAGGPDLAPTVSAMTRCQIVLRETITSTVRTPIAVVRFEPGPEWEGGMPAAPIPTCQLSNRGRSKDEKT
jgi:hypothetical protein